MLTTHFSELQLPSGCCCWSERLQSVSTKLHRHQPNFPGNVMCTERELLHFSTGLSLELRVVVISSPVYRSKLLPCAGVSAISHCLHIEVWTSGSSLPSLLLFLFAGCVLGADRSFFTSSLGDWKSVQGVGKAWSWLSLLYFCSSFCSLTLAALFRVLRKGSHPRYKKLVEVCFSPLQVFWFTGFHGAWIRPSLCPCFSGKCVTPLLRIPAIAWPILTFQHILCVPPSRSSSLPSAERAACDPAVKPAACLEAFRNPLYRSAFQYLLRVESVSEDFQER